MDIYNRHTSDFLSELRSNGRYAFSIEDIHREIHKPLKNISKDIDRLRAKGAVQNIRRGFYTVIPEEYRKMGAVPVEFYIDDLMKYLSKQYYVGLLSAAMLHGAAHQQPQEFFVITAPPKTRRIVKKSTIINFCEKKYFPSAGIEAKKTDTGYIKVSGKELTFLDLIYFEQTVGGLNRVITILTELSDDLSINRFKEALSNTFPAAVFQRAGYISEKVLKSEKLALVFEKKLSSLKYQTAYLKASGAKSGLRDDKWDLIINTNPESDL